MSLSIRKISLIISVIFLICVGLFFREKLSTDYLVHVDSYKFLVQSKSFASDVSKDFVKTNVGIEGKWGYPLLISAENSILKLQGSDLINLFRINNIILSISCGILLLIFTKSWSKLFAIPLLLSSLYIDYSSYVINEFLNLFLIIDIFIIAKNLEKLKSKQKLSAEIILGLIAGYLPFVRIESIVVSILILAYVFAKKNESFKKVSLSFITSFSLTGLIIFSITQKFNLSFITHNLWLVAGVGIGILSFVYLLKYHEKKLQNINLTIITFGLVVLPLTVDSFKNAASLDILLIIFLFAGFAKLLYLSGYKKVRLATTTTVFSTITIILACIFIVFNNEIDRYLLTIYGVAILTLVAGYEDLRLINWKKVSFRLGFVLITLVFFVGAMWNLTKTTPRKLDYQQEIMSHVQSLNNIKKLYLSGYLYIPYIYFHEAKPIIADKVNRSDLRSGDTIFVESSLQVTNPTLYDDIIHGEKDFILIQSYRIDAPFSYSLGTVENSGDFKIFVKK